MSPELITAIKERIAAGQNKEDIKAAVLALGHVEEVFESAYTLALHDIEKLVASSTPQADVQLPSVFDLIEKAVSFTLRRLDLVLFVLVPSLVFFGIGYVMETFTLSTPVSTTLMVASVVAFAVYLVAMLSVMYMVCTEPTPTFGTAWQWAKEHIWSLIWVSLLTFAVIFGGLILLVIPGIILGVHLYFSQYAFIIEGQRGMAALARSRALVKDRFWTIVGKFIGFGFVFFAPIFIGMLAVLAVVEYYPVLEQYTILGELAFEVVSAVFTVVGAYAMFELYQALQVGRPLDQATASRRRVLYSTLALFGVVAVGVLVFVAIKFGDEAMLEEALPTEVPLLQAELKQAHVAATLYHSEHNASYEGVCESLTRTVTVGEEVECNDTEGEWALAATLAAERWCTDSETENKRINGALQERTNCLLLPEKQEVTPVEQTITASTSPLE